MQDEPKGPQAGRLRQRKFELLRRYPIPEDLLPGSLSRSHLRCGKPTCHCAEGEGHPAWTLTFMVQGKKRVQHIPSEWVPEVQRRVQAGREFQQAVREVLAANAQLLVLARKQRRRGKGRRRAACGSMWRGIFVCGPTWRIPETAGRSPRFLPEPCSGPCESASGCASTASWPWKRWCVPRPGGRWG